MSEVAEKPKVVTEDILGDFGFRLVWTVESHVANVVAYEICGRDCESNAPIFENSPDSLTHVGAESYLTAMIKWDGCSHFNFGDKDGYIHLCGQGCYAKHCALIKYLWDRAGSLGVIQHDLAGEPKEWTEYRP